MFIFYKKMFKFEVLKELGKMILTLPVIIVYMLSTSTTVDSKCVVAS